MKLCYVTVYLVSIILQSRSVFVTSLAESHPVDEYLLNLKLLLTEISLAVPVENCFAVITDELHHSLYDGHFFEKYGAPRSYYYVKVRDTEDLLAPHYRTVRVLKQIRNHNCDLHFVTLLNGLQAKRFIRFVDKNRALHTANKFVFLHDSRTLETDMLPIWSNMISTIFVKRHLGNKFSISTISYPGILNGVVVTKDVFHWTKGRHIRSGNLFPDKSANLKGFDLPVVVFDHVPMVMRDTNRNTFFGLEVEIMRTLGDVLNFRPQFYETADRDTELWGRELPNGSFTGLIGQVINRAARLAIGDLHLYQLYAAVMEFSTPHSYDCLTFLTPESTQDNSWRTLIQPFSGTMWLSVLLSLIITGTLFYTISFIHALLLRQQTRTSSCNFFNLIRRRRHATKSIDSKTFWDARFRTYLSRLQLQPHQREDLFDNFANCILLTYSMLMYVALPRMPRNWPLRVLTGWYWLYCILVTVTYRASFTAILANPAARITIDSLDQLLKSGVTITTWGTESKHLFGEAFDTAAQDIGLKMEIITDIYGTLERIAKGNYAYLDNEYFLRHLRATGQKHESGNKVLHIMRECAVHMPVSIGLERNSPLKSHIDNYLQLMAEGGLIAKWLRDALQHLPSEEKAPQEALMDLRKFWSSFVALAFGYFLGLCAILGEKLHFKYIVCAHPLYDEYNPNLYYIYKRRYPH